MIDSEEIKEASTLSDMSRVREKREIDRRLWKPAVVLSIIIYLSRLRALTNYD